MACNALQVSGQPAPVHTISLDELKSALDSPQVLDQETVCALVDRFEASEEPRKLSSILQSEPTFPLVTFLVISAPNSFRLALTETNFCKHG